MNVQDKIVGMIEVFNAGFRALGMQAFESRRYTIELAPGWCSPEIVSCKIKGDFPSFVERVRGRERLLSMAIEDETEFLGLDLTMPSGFSGGHMNFWYQDDGWYPRQQYQDRVYKYVNTGLEGSIRIEESEVPFHLVGFPRQMERTIAELKKNESELFNFTHNVEQYKEAYQKLTGKSALLPRDAQKKLEMLQEKLASFGQTPEERSQWVEKSIHAYHSEIIRLLGLTDENKRLMELLPQTPNQPHGFSRCNVYACMIKRHVAQETTTCVKLAMCA